MKAISRAPSFMLAVALVGIVVAFYDSYAIYNHQPLWCPPPIDGCNIVAESPYARLFGICLSAGFMYIQFTYIHAFCIYWLISAIATLLLFIAAARHFSKTRSP